MDINMSMLEVTGGVVNVGVGLGRLRREVHSGVVDTDSTPDVQIITPLEHFLSKHRAVEAVVLFSTLNTSCRKKFYGRAAKYSLENGGGVVTYIFYIEHVARQFGLTIATCDRQAVHRLFRYFCYFWYNCY
jgi:hypothetical protein